MRFCPTCREEFPGEGPPYAVHHVMTDPPEHYALVSVRGQDGSLTVGKRVYLR